MVERKNTLHISHTQQESITSLIVRTTFKNISDVVLFYIVPPH